MGIAPYEGLELIETTSAERWAVAERTSRRGWRPTGGEPLAPNADDAPRADLLRLVGETLADLRDAPGVERLIARGAESLCRLGFQRSIATTLEGNTWLTESIRLDGDSEWSDDIREAGRLDPHGRGSGFAPPVSDSWVVAPVVHGSRLLGFVWADRPAAPDFTSHLDGELISVFAQGFAFALASALVVEELEALRAGVTTGGPHG